MSKPNIFQDQRCVADSQYASGLIYANNSTMNSTETKLDSFTTNVLRFEKSDVVTQTNHGIQKNFTVAANMDENSYPDNNVEYLVQENKSPGGYQITRSSKQKECKQEDGLEQIRLERVYFSSNVTDDKDNLNQQNSTDIQRKTENPKPVIFQALQGRNSYENRDYTTIVTNTSAYYAKPTNCVHGKGIYLFSSEGDYFNHTPRVIPERSVPESFLNEMEHVSDESSQNGSAICYYPQGPHQMFRDVETQEPLEQTGCLPFKNSHVINTAQLQPLDNHERSLSMVQEKLVPIRQRYSNTTVPVRRVINTYVTNSHAIGCANATACNVHDPSAATLGSNTHVQLQNATSTSWEDSWPTYKQYSVAIVDAGTHKYEPLSGSKRSSEQIEIPSRRYEALMPKLQNVRNLHAVVMPSEPKPVEGKHLYCNSHDTQHHYFGFGGPSKNPVSQAQQRVHSCNRHLNTLKAGEGPVSKRMHSIGANRSFQNQVLQLNNSWVPGCVSCEYVEPSAMYSQAFVTANRGKQQNCVSKIDHLPWIMTEWGSASGFSDEHFMRPKRQGRKMVYRTTPKEAEHQMEDAFDPLTKPGAFSSNEQRRVESKTGKHQDLKRSLSPKLISPESRVKQGGSKKRTTDRRGSLNEPYSTAGDKYVIHNTPFPVLCEERHGLCNPKQNILPSKAEKQHFHVRCPKRKFNPSIASFRLDTASPMEERFSLHVSQPDWIDSHFKWSGVSHYVNKKKKRTR